LRCISFHFLERIVEKMRLYREGLPPWLTTGQIPAVFGAGVSLSQPRDALVDGAQRASTWQEALAVAETEVARVAMYGDTQKTTHNN
jgi:hypothetical protein